MHISRTITYNKYQQKNGTHSGQNNSSVESTVYTLYCYDLNQVQYGNVLYSIINHKNVYITAQNEINFGIWEKLL